MALAVDRKADMPWLLDWAWALNEIQIIRPKIQDERLVDGSTGQVTLNPLISYMKVLLGIVERTAKEFGMSPVSREKLGLTIGQSKVTAATLNDDLDRTSSDNEVKLARLLEEFQQA